MQQRLHRAGAGYRVVDTKQHDAVKAFDGSLDVPGESFGQKQRDHDRNIAHSVPFGSGSTGLGWTEIPIPATIAASFAITPGSTSDHVRVTLPDLGKPNLPVVIASTGMMGVGGTKPPQAYPYPNYTKVEQAQLWVAGVTQPANVLSDDTRYYWREANVSPSTTSYHWNHNAESYFLVGKALGDNMVDLLTP